MLRRRLRLSLLPFFSMEARRPDFSSPAKASFQSSKSQSALSNRDLQILPYAESRIDGLKNNHGALPPPPLRSKSSSSWSLSSPDTNRRRRVASYKMYTAEGKVKSSFSRSFRWVKDKFLELRDEWL